MPTYRSITLSLISQYDILVIPEFPPPSVPADPFSASPQLIDTARSIVSTYIPTYPSSQFWVAYSIAPPHPPNALYFFKLFINGAEVVSWGCGEEDEFKGKTMYTLSLTPTVIGKPVYERQALCFGKAGQQRQPKGAMDDVMEVRVFRSKGRKRIVPEPQPVPQSLSGISAQCLPNQPSGPTTRAYQQPKGSGVELVNAGILPRDCPQRYYRYALFDPLDSPFATFRYYYRSIDELYSLNIIPASPSLSNQSSCSTLHSEAHEDSDNARSAQGSPSPSAENDVILSSPNQSPLYHQYASHDASHQYLPDFSSPLSKISEEPSSSKSTPISTPTHTPIDSITPTSHHVRTDSSPLRIPRPKPSTDLPLGLGISGIELEEVARPPTPPAKSPFRRGLPALPKSSLVSTPRAADRLLRTQSSKEDFANLIRETTPVSDAGKMRLRDTPAVGEDNENVRTPESAVLGKAKVGRKIDVGALRKVFEKRRE